MVIDYLFSGNWMKTFRRKIFRFLEMANSSCITFTKVTGDTSLRLRCVSDFTKTECGMCGETFIVRVIRFEVPSSFPMRIGVSFT